MGEINCLKLILGISLGVGGWRSLDRFVSGADGPVTRAGRRDGKLLLMCVLIYVFIFASPFESVGGFQVLWYFLFERYINLCNRKILYSVKGPIKNVTGSITSTP